MVLVNIIVLVVRDLTGYSNSFVCILTKVLFSHFHFQIKWCMMVYIDDEYINELCDVPQMSTDAFMFFHVFKRLNQLPTPKSKFESWATYATLAGLEMPPPIGTLCRSGPQFRAFTNPVIFYEAAIGSSFMASDVVPFRKVHKMFHFFF